MAIPASQAIPSEELQQSDNLNSSLQDDQDVDEVEDEEDVMEEDPESLTADQPEYREISSLASWTVSTYKPGCGVAALLSPNPGQFWQSDGPQPHLLNIHFFKLVSIARLRIYLDLELDESYTPTRMQFLAGHSEYDLVEFAEWRAVSTEGPRGWVDVSLDRCWGRGDEEDGDEDGEPVLRCMFLQMRVLENHQNGKDTHIRGVQIWARPEKEVRQISTRENSVSVSGVEPRNAWEEQLETWIEGDWKEVSIR